MSEPKGPVTATMRAYSPRGGRYKGEAPTWLD